jgi:enediyne biosynthesis protein E3
LVIDSLHFQGVTMIGITGSAEVAGATPNGWRRLLALSPATVDFDRRGFRTRSTSTRGTLEAAAGAFVIGFNRTLAVPAGHVPDLAELPQHRRGFAVEGAAMAAALLDLVTPGRGRRLPAVEERYGERYVYLIQVGTGWAMAMLRRRRLGPLGGRYPLLRWLAYDGMGFCRAYFASPRGLRRWFRHSTAPCAATCAIQYQGFGRSLWFRECADPDAVAGQVARLPAQHIADAWSGVGLAASYALGIGAGGYERLRTLAGDHGAALAQGAAFAAEAWRRSGHLPPRAGMAIRTLTGIEPAEAADWTWRARQGVDGAGASAEDYYRWRARIQQYAAEATYR